MFQLFLTGWDDQGHPLLRYQIGNPKASRTLRLAISYPKLQEPKIEIQADEDDRQATKLATDLFVSYVLDFEEKMRFLYVTPDWKQMPAI